MGLEGRLTEQSVNDELPADIAGALDDWRRVQAPPLSRDEAISAILRDWLIGHGLLPFSDE